MMGEAAAGYLIAVAYLLLLLKASYGCLRSREAVAATWHSAKSHPGRAIATLAFLAASLGILAFILSAPLLH